MFSEGLRKEVPLLLRLKDYYGSGHFWDAKELNHKEFGVSSKSAFRNQLLRLKRNGWIKMVGEGTFITPSFDKLRAEKGLKKPTTYVKIDTTLSKNKLIGKINAIIVHDKNFKMQFNIRKRSQYKASNLTVIDGAQSKQFTVDKGSLPFISYAYLAKILGFKSGASAHTAIKNLIEQGYLKKYNCVEHGAGSINFKGVKGKVLSNFYEVHQPAIPREFQKVLNF